MRERGTYNEALIIIISRFTGESLGENGRLGHGGLYLEELMVPLIIKPPASWDWHPQVIEQPVELVDVMPNHPGKRVAIALPNELDGRSLLPMIQGRGGGREALIAQTTYREWPDLVTRPAKRAIWDPGTWLLIHDVAADARELFDLANDARGLTAAGHEQADTQAALLGTPPNA